MTNPTTPFSWQMPTATDLVTDLPADFETFGQAVATSMADLLGGTTGQILSKNSNTDMDFVWITNDVGDITAVTAGTGISGGGTSGSVTITNSMATEISAKGDLIVGTGSQTFDNLGVGTNGQLLQADSTTATGLKWATVSTSPTFVGCCVTNNGGNVTYTANVAQTLNFTSEDFDTNGFHSNTTNTSRITIPTGYAGKYLINTNWRVGVGVGYVITKVYKNASGSINGLEGGELTRVMNQGSNSFGLNGSTILDLAVGDYVEMIVQTDYAGTSGTWARFSATYLGA